MADRASYIITNPMEGIFRMKKIIGGFFCALFLAAQLFLPSMVQAAGSVPAPQPVELEQTPAAGEPGEEFGGQLYAASAVLMDADSGRVLYGKNEDAPMAMASTTKIMTCIVLLENMDPEETLTVSSYAASMPKVKLNLNQGEQYRAGDLLYSLMLESHNDSAVALAEHVGRKYLPEELQSKDPSEFTPEESRQAVAAFAALMNQKAGELGCRDTYFITPNGLDASEEVVLESGETVTKDHCTTAKELAKIMSYCIKESPRSAEFLEITRTQSYSFTANGRSFSCNNHNAFLGMMDGALTGKTGFTNKAGYCYVGALERDGRTFVVALLACGWPNHKTYKWSDTRALMQYGVDHYFYRAFGEEPGAFDASSLHPIPVQGGRADILGTTAYMDVGLGQTNPGTEDNGQPEGLLMRQDEKVQVECRVAGSLTAPVAAGTRVGSVSYLVDGAVYRTEEIVTLETVEEIDFSWCVEQVLLRFGLF